MGVELLKTEKKKKKKDIAIYQPIALMEAGGHAFLGRICVVDTDSTASSSRRNM